VELVFNNKHPWGVKMPEYARVCVCATPNIFKLFLSMAFQVHLPIRRLCGVWDQFQICMNLIMIDMIEVHFVPRARRGVLIYSTVNVRKITFNCYNVIICYHKLSTNVKSKKGA